MKKLTLLKSILLVGVIISAKNANAQLASDMPAQSLNRPLLSSKQDTIKVLASERAKPIDNNSTTNKNNSIPGNVVLPSESVITKPNEIKNRRKQ